MCKMFSIFAKNFAKIESSKRREFDLSFSLLGKCSKDLKFLFFWKIESSKRLEFDLSSSLLGVKVFKVLKISIFWENWKFEATRIRSFLLVIREMLKVFIFWKNWKFKAMRIRSFLLVISSKCLKFPFLGKLEVRNDENSIFSSRY